MTAPGAAFEKVTTMKIAIKKERGVLTITLNHDIGKKPVQVQLNEAQAQAVISMLSIAAKADAFEFAYAVGN